MVGLLGVANASADEWRLATAAAARTATRIDFHSVMFGEFQEVGVLAVPNQSAPGFTKTHVERQGDTRACFVVLRERRLIGRHRRGPEGLEVNVLGTNSPDAQRRDQTRHHRRRAADIEPMATVRQGATQQVDVHVSGVLVVAALDVVGAGTAVDHIQMETGMRCSQLFERLHPEDVALANPVMKVAGRCPRRQLRSPGRRQRPLDGDAIARRTRAVGKRVAACDRAVVALHSRSAVGNPEREGEVLARLKRRQWRAVNGLQVKRALGLGCVFKFTTNDTEFAPAEPGTGRDRCGFGGSRTSHHLVGTASPPCCNTDPPGQLKQQGQIDVGKQLERGHVGSCRWRRLQAGHAALGFKTTETNFGVR